jgi:hypothetical protein
LSVPRLPNNWVPRDYQWEAWDYLWNGGLHAELVWHRRSGKDELALHWAAVAAMKRPAGYWHMLPEAAQARKAIWDAVDPHTGKRRIDQAFPHEIRANTRDQDMLIRFKNGSTWQVLGSDNYDSLVGSPPAGVVFSEWAMAKPEARAFLRPILAENGGWQVYVTTPRGPNHAKATFEAAKADPLSFAQLLTARQTSVFTKQQLAIELASYQVEYGQDRGMALFEQEYLCSFEAILTGLTVFGRKAVSVAREECYKPKYVGEVERSSGSYVERQDGNLKVWAKPKSGKRYVIGADVAEGLDNGDYSSADVLEFPKGNQVAQWHGHIDPDQFGVVLARLGNWYNAALVGVERNNHGLTTVTKLRDLKYRNQYAQEDLEHRADGKQTKKLGWLTTEKSKLKIIDQIAAELRDGTHGLACEESVNEMQSYIINEKGAYTAAPGCFDDRVMSRAIAGEMLRNVPRSHSATTATGNSYKPLDAVSGY